MFKYKHDLLSSYYFFTFLFIMVFSHGFIIIFLIFRILRYVEINLKTRNLILALFWKVADWNVWENKFIIYTDMLATCMAMRRSEDNC